MPATVSVPAAAVVTDVNDVFAYASFAASASQVCAIVAGVAALRCVGGALIESSPPQPASRAAADNGAIQRNADFLFKITPVGFVTPVNQNMCRMPTIAPSCPIPAPGVVPGPPPLTE
ncbi:hypothetical protein BconGalA64_31920 [Burkholderia contaminans]|nr:hypothetical protein BconGalA64_31920 [Burkholderia contaminans]